MKIQLINCIFKAKFHLTKGNQESLNYLNQQNEASKETKLNKRRILYKNKTEGNQFLKKSLA